MDKMNMSTTALKLAFFMGCSLNFYGMEEKDDNRDWLAKEPSTQPVLDETKKELTDHQIDLVDQYDTTMVQNSHRDGINSLTSLGGEIARQENDLQSQSITTIANNEASKSGITTDSPDEEIKINLPNVQLIVHLNQGNEKMVEELISKKKANPNMLQGTFLSLPVIAIPIWQNNVFMVKVLIKYGADPYFRSDLGQSPVEYAIITFPDRHAVIEALLSNSDRNQKNINKTNHRGISLLHQAISVGSAKIVELLLKAGADPKLENPFCRTPIQHAELLLHHEIVSLLSSEREHQTTATRHMSHETTSSNLMNRICSIRGLLPFFHALVALLIVDYVVALVHHGQTR